MRTRHGLATITVAFVLTALLALSTTGTASAQSVFYLSVGTSLSVGVEPNAAGKNRRTQQGYADQLHAMAGTSGLQLVKLGCPGETSVTMIAGGICDYPLGSQLAQAVRFLEDHQGSVAFVTIDVGANDIEPCGSVSGQEQQLCVVQAIGDVATNLPQILGALRAAAGQDVPIIGMNYYNPFLASWFLDPALAAASTVLQITFNNVLGSIYGIPTFGVVVADVAGAFSSYDVSLVGGIPHNVLTVCQLTWMCTPPPVGPNIHPNADGYAVIAGAFLPLLP
jgi:lysophospholipase L1-like esterase